MKPYLIFFISSFISSQTFAQNITDIVLSDSGYGPSVVIDPQGNIHMSYDGNGIYYQEFNPSGIPVKSPKHVGSTSKVSNSPAIALIKENAMIAWSEVTMTFNHYI